MKMVLNRLAAGIGWMVMAVLLGSTQVAVAGTSWDINRFELAWQSASPDLPSLDALQRTPFRLSRTANGLSVKASGTPGIRTDLTALNRQRRVHIDAAGLDVIAAAIQGELEAGGLMGVIVEPSLQQVRMGQSPSYNVWFIADFPLPGFEANAALPSDLVPLHQQRVAGEAVAGIHLQWQGESDSMPAPSDLLRSLTVPVAVRGGVVMSAPRDSMPLRQLSDDRKLRWTPEAIGALTAAIGNAASQNALPGTATLDHTERASGMAGVTLNYIAHVTLPPAPEKQVKTVVIAAPPAAVTEVTKAPPPAVVAEAAKAPPPAAVAEAAKAPPVEVSKVEQVDGIHIVWPPEHEAWGSADSLFTLTSVRLRLVDDAVQAGWGETGDLLPVADLQRFPTRGWQPSATRAVRNALQSRLTEVGMTHTQLTEAIVDQEDGRFVVFTLHPPPRPEYMPPLAIKSEIVDGGVYYVAWPFEVMYAAPHTQLPAASSFEWISVALGHDEHGWTGSSEGPRAAITLAALNEAGPMLYDADAIKAIGNAISRHLVNQDLMGIGVRPLQSQIPSTGPDAGADLRGDRTELTLVVTVGRVVEVRTIASGGRVDGEERVNHPTHQRIADQSPLQGGDVDGEGSLIRRKELDEYLYFLSRHPGRDIEGSVTNQLVSQNVEPSIAGEGPPIAIELTEAEGGLAGGAYLTYRIAEEKPWSLWFQYGNTGTKSEGYQRFRAGFVHSQLTGNDDILSLQYVTSNGSDTNAVIGSYEAPLGLDGRLRWGVNGSWSQYFADQFGVSGFPNEFTGHSWAGGGDLRLNVYQDGPFFTDIIGGARLQHLSASNDLLGFELQEQASFLIPYGMIQFDRNGQWSNLRGSIGMEANVTSHDAQQLARLGFVTNRFNPANQWARLNWSTSLSVYLEPLIDLAAWTDPSTPGSSTLAHELLVNFSGQYAFGNRLLPQFQSVAGGPGTNRGYPVSIAAGDNAINLTGEYRFHLPRTFGMEAEPGRLFGEPFRVSPQHVYGRPDWDLVLLGFLDASWLTQNGDILGEFNETLVSAGVGFELAIKRNLQIRLDWGWALKSLQNGLYDSGHNRVYVQASLSF
ncbi:MAG: ShlB/FhaC/HecB family hemolysin secretion/activation protein [Phycisphaerales bacterium]|nr:ShlB/FhaC/HecB family hemolysin secretion/activation protein [Phycisphaerales bacterium]